MRARLRGEDGMTLVEVLVSMVVSLLVLGAVLTIFEGFERGAKANERLTGAQDSGRRGMATMVRTLRNAGAPTGGLTQPAGVLRAQGDDLIVRTTDWPGESRRGTGVHLVRYCLNPARDTLYLEGLRAGTTGPADPGTACPSGAPGWERQTAVQHVANGAGEPVFEYGTTTSGIRSVGIDLAIQAGTAQRARPTHLRSAATLRGAVLPEVDDDDISGSCPPDGSGALLSLGLAVDGEGNPLTLLPVSGSGGVSVGPAQVLVPPGTSTVQLIVKNALGLQKLLLKEVPSC